MTHRRPCPHRLRRARDLLRSVVGGAALGGGFLALCWAAGLASIP